MTNAKMTKEFLNPNDEGGSIRQIRSRDLDIVAIHSNFGIRASFGIRHSDFLCPYLKKMSCKRSLYHWKSFLPEASNGSTAGYVNFTGYLDVALSHLWISE